MQVRARPAVPRAAWDQPPLAFHRSRLPSCPSVFASWADRTAYYSTPCNRDEVERRAVRAPIGLWGAACGFLLDPGSEQHLAAAEYQPVPGRADDDLVHANVRR